MSIMTSAYDDKREAVEQWTQDPCGLSGAQGFEIGTKAFYERVDRSRYEEYAPWMRSTLGFARFGGQKLLEVGFGLGTDLFQFAASGATVAGVDLSPAHLRIASRRFGLYGIPADLRLGDAENLPFEDSSFDVVYSFGVLHHTPDTKKAVDEILRILKPGGRSIIGVYHRYSAFYLFAVLGESYLLRLGFLRESYRRTLSKIEHREHSNACPLVKLYSRRSLRRLLQGFREVQIECRHLKHSDFGAWRRLVPPALARELDRRGLLGWYLIAKCTK